MFQLFRQHDNKLCKMYTGNEVQDCHGNSSIRQEEGSFQQQILFIYQEESSKALYDAETWTLQKVDQKHKESNEMWCWRRMKMISWIDRVRN